MGMKTHRRACRLSAAPCSASSASDRSAITRLGVFATSVNRTRSCARRAEKLLLGFLGVAGAAGALCVAAGLSLAFHACTAVSWYAASISGDISGESPVHAKGARAASRAWRIDCRIDDRAVECRLRSALVFRFSKVWVCTFQTVCCAGGWGCMVSSRSRSTQGKFRANGRAGKPSGGRVG